MSDSPSHAFTPAALDRIHRLLEAHWSAASATSAASAAERASDPVAPRSIADYTGVVAGMLAAGGTKAEVVAFLRGEEEALLGGVRTAPQDLAAIGRGAWLAARGRSVGDAADDD